MNVYALRNIYVESELVSGQKGGLYAMPVYSPKPVFYVQLGNLPIKQVRINRKSLIGAYPEFSDRIRHILRSGHTGRITQEYKLVEAVQLINNNW